MTDTKKVAVIGIGYGDGYPRHIQPGAQVLIRQQRVPVVGRVSMDMLTVDVTDLQDISVGSPVELWGGHVAVDEVAALAGTIGYELLAGMPDRVPREYCGSDC